LGTIVTFKPNDNRLPKRLSYFITKIIPTWLNFTYDMADNVPEKNFKRTGTLHLAWFMLSN